MECQIPNFGQYGYIQPKSWLNWKVLLGFAGAFILGYILYSVFSKEEGEKNDDEKKEPLASGTQQKIT